MRNMPAAAFLRLTWFKNQPGHKLYSLKADTLRGLIEQADYNTLYELAKWFQHKEIDVSAAIGVMQIVDAIVSERIKRLNAECFNKRRRLTIEYENSDSYGLWQAYIRLDHECRHLQTAYTRLIRWHAIAVHNEWVEKLRAALLAQIED